MSTTTPNLGLHQWASSDYVNHEDFNSDNLIIDGAMAHLYRVPIAEYTTTATANPLEIDLSGISWGQFEHVYVRLTLASTNSSFSNIYFNSTSAGATTWNVPASSGTQYSGSGGELMVGSAGRTIVFRFDPFKNVSAGVSGQCTVQGYSPLWLGDGSKAYSSLTKLVIAPYSANSDGYINSGAQIKIWGVK